MSRSTSAEQDPMQMRVGDARRGARTSEGYVPIVQNSSRGTIDMRYYPSPGATGGAIFVGGAGGGFDTSVCGWLYPRLCQQLSAHDHIAGLRVRYRHPNHLEECVMDVLAGVNFLAASEQISAIALTGHSFGGAVVIQAAAHAPDVRACIALSTQTYGADAAAELGPRCSLLLAHGQADEILAPECSKMVYRNARQPKRLLLKEGVHHGLDEWADELPDIVRAWIGAELST